MSKINFSQLTIAMNERQLVSLTRRYENSKIRGYVMAMGAEFFLLALVSDRIWFDGFECFRIKDIRSVKADPYASFAEAVLKKRGEKRPRKPKVDIESVESILLTASKVFPLVTIHMEKKDPDACFIGAVHEVKNGKLSLLCITPLAKWESSPDMFPIKKITRISFGGDYEDALHIVGGDAE